MRYADYAESPPLLRRSPIKNGAPITAVKIESGISALLALRANVSIITIKLAPKPMLNGTTVLLLLPISIREMCGIRSPTQPT